MTLWWAAVPALLAIPATWMGHRRTRGVRTMKTAVTLAMMAIAFVAVVGAGGAFELGVRGAVDPRVAESLGWLLVAGIACTVLADWLLAPVDNSRTFVAGLAAFLVGYLLYALVLLAGSAGHLLAIRASQRAAAVGVALIPAAGITLWQYTRLSRIAPSLRVAVIAYMVVATLLLTGGVAAVVWPLASGGSFAAVGASGWFACIAAVMIYWSDSLIARNLFHEPLAHEQLWIMPTYYAGQVAMLLAILISTGDA